MKTIHTIEKLFHFSGGAIFTSIRMILTRSRWTKTFYPVKLVTDAHNLELVGFRSSNWICFFFGRSALVSLQLNNKRSCSSFRTIFRSNQSYLLWKYESIAKRKSKSAGFLQLRHSFHWKQFETRYVRGDPNKCFARMNVTK